MPTRGMKATGWNSRSQRSYYYALTQPVGRGSWGSLTHDFLISFARKLMMGEGKRGRRERENRVRGAVGKATS